MQNENERATAGGGGRGGRSSVERLPSAVRDAVAAAIEDGATIDEVTAGIRALGGDCSRSAVGRYVKQMRGLTRRQHEIDRCAETWVRTLGERAEGRSGLIALEALRSLALLTVGALCEKAEKAEKKEEAEEVPAEEIARLALALRRIEGADRLRVERERAVAGTGTGTGTGTRGEPVSRATEIRRQGGLSDDAVFLLRQAIEGELFPHKRRLGGDAHAEHAQNTCPAKSHGVPENPGS